MSGNFQIIDELRTHSRALGLDLKEIGRRLERPERMNRKGGKPACFVILSGRS